LSANFRGNGWGGRPPTNVGVSKLESLGYRVVLFQHPTFSRFGTMLACDGETDRRTHDDSKYRASIARVKTS